MSVRSTVHLLRPTRTTSHGIVMITWLCFPVGYAAIS
ncbi:hypothetical protein FB564_3332 [Salinispora arenicola]|uniref:Uncharacterized protein n=1 Tax=Salinispora arenicola TaxID=168697 RepID=A0A542XQL9_SALAC|nr:hypothetical protein FB564_3332 [Salinispora arenicola]